MKKKTSEMTIAELRARAAEIRTEVNAEGADLDALEAEADEISQRIAQYETEQRRLGIAAKVADGAGAPQDNPTASTDAQTRAQQFKENRRAVLGVEETRAVLVSGGKLATPTEVNTEIQDRVGVGVSSIIDMVWVDDCAGMSTDRIPYVKQDADAAADQTEGAAATTKEATYDYIDITPKSEAVLSQISKQAKKLTPVNYFAKCRAQALLSLRKKASVIVTDALKASKLVSTIDATLDSTKSSWQAMRWVTVKVRAIIPTQAVCASKAIFPTAIAGLHLIRSARHEKRTSLHTASMLMQKRDTAISVPAVGTHESNVSATRALSHRQARH